MCFTFFSELMRKAHPRLLMAFRLYANGVTSSSPGLPRSGYPGSQVGSSEQNNSEGVASFLRSRATTPLGHAKRIERSHKWHAVGAHSSRPNQDWDAHAKDIRTLDAVGRACYDRYTANLNASRFHSIGQTICSYMIDELVTLAEKKAQEAERLAGFDGINLLGLKRKLKTILGLIGRDGIFDEYTMHDISHIDTMLVSLDWLIPEKTKAVMSPADWLMEVLAIYFHDLGMLVTRDEYSNRHRSGFQEFCEQILFSEDEGVDYKAKVEKLSTQNCERFLYQEFVRHTHAMRIREWIMGKASEKFGCSHQMMEEVSDLLETLDDQFRRDLGLICESHHLDDLNDFEKYRVSQPYGNSDDETVNLQYVAILLRTTDLLHITRDRTPSIAFRLINPRDPISQLEWAKQRAVKRVRSQIARNREGLPDENAPRDTIEVHAFFTNPEGFFGLTSYLDYAQLQLQKSFEWLQEASKTQGSRHEFPWKYIDDASIEASGFLKESFRFTIDQAKILDLLTGHTLYNETSVVLRELVQNSLDAIRLRLHIGENGGFSDAPGCVRIEWNSEQRLLSIVDNGTGMTQSTIQKHLLKVGASQYQDPEFKKQFPDFSSISRFGIGVLSTFMIADDVEIITNHPKENEARMLNLRSVHGKYLIQLLDKSNDDVPEDIQRHGTSVRLHVRPSATMKDVLATAQRWVVIPQCDVTVTVDGGEPTKIGFSSPSDVLYAAVDQTKHFVRWDQQLDDGDRDYRTKIRVEEFSTSIGTIAFALKWWEYFDEWAFLEASELTSNGRSSSLGICIEGIRVDFNPAGYRDVKGIAAIVNTTGPNAPRTNVARSGLERTPEFEELLRFIYTSYCRHVKDELAQMQKRNLVSLTWAAQEARWLLRPLLDSNAISSDELVKAVHRLPIILAERDSGRSAVSVAELQKEEDFWTIDGQFFRSAERLIREVSSSASLTGIIRALDAKGLELPVGTIICDSLTIQRAPYQAVFDGKEIDQIRIDRNQRRLDLRWATRIDPPRWCELPAHVWKTHLTRELAQPQLYLASDNIEIEGRVNETAVRTHKKVFVLPDSQLAEYMFEILALTDKKDDVLFRFAIMAFIVINERFFSKFKGDAEDWPEYFSGTHNRRIMDDMNFDSFERILDQDELFRMFDASVWTRKEDV